MALPNWVKKHRQPKTEIRQIRGNFYLYRIDYKYSPEKKRTQKITLELLGKITKKEGFVRSAKDRLRDAPSKISIADYGAYELFIALMRQELKHLSVFDQWRVIAAIAMLRWIHQSPIKNMPQYWQQCYLSQQWKLSLTAKGISRLLREVGEQRADILSYLANFRSAGGHLLIDSTDIPTKSERLGINHYGYNSKMRYSLQVNLLFLFSQQLQQPVYYRMLPGNIRDVKALRYSIQECGISQAVLVSDKGFYSKANVIELENNKLDYIIPLRRNNPLIDYKPLSTGNKHQLSGYFQFRKKIIWYYSYLVEGHRIVQFVDDKLRAQEQEDYLLRIPAFPEEYTQEGFLQRQYTFGTLTVITNLREDLPNQIYESYKSRAQIEQVFDSYKNFLHADRTYMQNEKAMEGWFFVNFLAMQAYYKLFLKLKKLELLKIYSPEDVIMHASSLRKLQLKGKWIDGEITKKSSELIAKVMA